MSFDCPFCNWECESFEESDEHFIEHMSEYQSDQDQEFGKYSE